MSEATQMYIGGRFVEGGGGTLTVSDPATDEAVITITTASPVDLDVALGAAATGLSDWRATDPWTRSGVLRRVAELIRGRADQMAAVLTREQGKPLAQSKAEVLSAADQFDWCADETRRIYGRVVEARASTDRILVRREPVGVVAAFTPWNFPSLLPARKIAAALAAGCSIIIKPAEETPLSCFLLAAACHDAGVPAGVVNVVVGDPAMISAHLIGSATVRKVALTGSVPVGAQLMALAASGVKAISLELGGHAPVVVFDDVDPAAAGVQCAEAKFRNAGQVCISATRFIVHESIRGRFVDAFSERTRALRLGPGGDPSSDIGPLTNRRRLESVERLVEDAVDKGAKVTVGGRRPPAMERGHWYEPTVLTDVAPGMEVLRTEPFGPVAPISTFCGFDEAIAMANASDYGLAGYVLTNDLSRAMLASEALDVGMVGVNNFAIATAEAPFGGVKSSGFGREGGSEGVGDYLVTKYVNLRLGDPARALAENP
jgi:succinate-semialdehyde dehydrogenase / glutarate-semialdehyde dehydrogenase